MLLREDFSEATQARLLAAARNQYLNSGEISYDELSGAIEKALQ
jgi:hypothetical protein